MMAKNVCKIRHLFSTNTLVLSPLQSEKKVFLSILSAVVVVIACGDDNFRQINQIAVCFGTLYQGREIKDEFVSQTNLTKCQEIRPFSEHSYGIRKS